MFQKYLHLERYGNTEVEGIDKGECYVFPKLDGTNASVWVNEKDSIQAGSRNRQLMLENDNAGFYKYIQDNQRIKNFFTNHPMFILYGEWLVPHTLKIYKEDAWGKFYVFDVYCKLHNQFVPFKSYKHLLKDYSIDYIPPLDVLIDPTYDQLQRLVEGNTYLIEEGNGIGEGIVIKNYNFINKFGRTTWAKLLSEQFSKTSKQEHKVTSDLVEEKICNKYITPHLVNKTYNKIVNETNGWSNKAIPRLLNTVYYDLINEELWDIVKKFKNPTINFRTLNKCCNRKIKETKPELF